MGPSPSKPDCSVAAALPGTAGWDALLISVGLADRRPFLGLVNRLPMPSRLSGLCVSRTTAAVHCERALHCGNLCQRASRRFAAAVIDIGGYRCRTMADLKVPRGKLRST